MTVVFICERKFVFFLLKILFTLFVLARIIMHNLLYFSLAACGLFHPAHVYAQIAHNTLFAARIEQIL